ncbi:MAG: RidA family protein [Gammaproteobacteria bacterium]|jgi:enamine deaminase RidA (YjgF/YER057c/UK114 family)|nr:RidA family protein [Gammaproteobacteria bacterium]
MEIEKHHTSPRMSQLVIHGDTIYLAGQVANDQEADITTQTEQVLEKIDEYLNEAGSDKSKILSAQIWLSNMAYFGEMNHVWEAWMPPGYAPARACIEARLAQPGLLVEIGIIAAR